MHIRLMELFEGEKFKVTGQDQEFTVINSWAGHDYSLRECEDNLNGEIVLFHENKVVEKVS